MTTPTATTKARPRFERAVFEQVAARLRTRNAQSAQPRTLVDGRPPGLTIKAAADTDDVELMIYAEIGWFGVMAEDVAYALTGVTGPLHVRINSPGGDVFDGVAIYNMLADHPAAVTVTVDGMAASAASFIAQAGDTIRMNNGAVMMIHDAATYCYGNATDMDAASELLNRVSDIIAGIYSDRAGGPPEQWRKAMRAESWYNGPEAVTAGLADEVCPSRHAKGDDGEEEGGGGEEMAARRWGLLAAFHYSGRAGAPAPPRIGSGPSAVHHTDTVDEEWDGPGSVSAMPAKAAVLKYCHAWVDDDGDADKKASYKFPHHKTEGGPANLAACRNGLARLSSADIPDADRAGVESHLRAHLDDAGDGDDQDEEGGGGEEMADVAEEGTDPEAKDPPTEPAPEPEPEPEPGEEQETGEEEGGEDEPATATATTTAGAADGLPLDLPATTAALDDWADITAQITGSRSSEDEFARLMEEL